MGRGGTSMRRLEYFFEETLPGQLLGTLGAAAVPGIILILGVCL